MIKPIKVLYVQKTGDYMKSAGDAWKELLNHLQEKGIAPSKIRAIGISHDDPHTTDKDKLRYDACAFIENNTQPESELQKQTIAGGLYAVFTHYGSYDNLYKLYEKIFREWIPTSGKKIRNIPMFEDYLIWGQNEKDSTKWITDIYLPIEE